MMSPVGEDVEATPLVPPSVYRSRPLRFAIPMSRGGGLVPRSSLWPPNRARPGFTGEHDRYQCGQMGSRWRQWRQCPPCMPLPPHVLPRGPLSGYMPWPPARTPLWLRRAWSEEKLGRAKEGAKRPRGTPWPSPRTLTLEGDLRTRSRTACHGSVERTAWRCLVPSLERSPCG